jgi:hypothetical protein
MIPARDPYGSPTSRALRAIGFWFRDTLTEIVNEISTAVLDDMSENSLIDSNESYKMLGLPEIEPISLRIIDESPLDSPSDTGSTNSGPRMEDEEFEGVIQDSTISKSPIISRINDIYTRRFSREDAIFKRIIYKLTPEQQSPSSTATTRSIDEAEFDIVMVEPIERSVMVADDWSGL